MLMIRNLNEPEQPGFCSYVSATILWAAESIVLQLLVHGYLHVVSNLVTSRAMGEGYHKHMNGVKKCIKRCRILQVLCSDFVFS